MKIGVIGAGFAGCAVSWFLKEKGHEVTLFDAQEIGQGASGIAAGLLHCFAGAHAKLNPLGREGMVATRKLLDVASENLGEAVYEASGLLRVATKEWQVDDYRVCAEKYDDVRWCSKEECQEMVPGVGGMGGIFIESACTVYTEKYLKGVVKGIEFVKKRVEDLSSFDAAVVTMGAATTSLPECSDLPIKPIKGQLLEFEWPFTPLPFPVNSQAYMVGNPNRQSCIVGATFEKQFENEEPNLEVAMNELRPKYTALFPELEHCKVLGCRAGVRASTPDHRPICKQIGERQWVLAGLGSKGLLHHALYAEELAASIHATLRP